MNTKKGRAASFPRSKSLVEDDDVPFRNIVPLTHQSSSGNLISYPKFVQIAKVSYQNLLIGIFTDSSEKNPSRFFFEPIVILDPKSISSQTNQLFKQDVVHFTIKMWSSELRFKILDRLRSLPNFKNQEIHEEDICVMPYKEVQLVLKPGSSMDQSIQLMDQPMVCFYPHSRESLEFYFICDSRSTADILAENFKSYPAFVLQKWKLALEGRRLVDQDTGVPSNTVTIDVSTLSPQEIAHSESGSTGHLRHSLIKDSAYPFQDLSGWMSAMIKKRKWTNCIPVFSAKKCRNPDYYLESFKNSLPYVSSPCPAIDLTPLPGVLGYSSIDMDQKDGIVKHGDFDLLNGTFTVKTAGLYLFHFSGYFLYSECGTKNSGANLIQLRVNTKPVAQSVTIDEWDNNKWKIKDEDAAVPFVLSTFLTLNVGDEVDSYSDDVIPHENPDSCCTTRFSAFYFSDDE